MLVVVPVHDDDVVFVLADDELGEVVAVVQRQDVAEFGLVGPLGFDGQFHREVFELVGFQKRLGVGDPVFSEFDPRRVFHPRDPVLKVKVFWPEAKKQGDQQNGVEESG